MVHEVIVDARIGMAKFRNAYYLNEEKIKEVL
jgi:hypothetical protein